MRAAFVQFAPAYLAVEDNLDHVAALLDGVEADLIVLPELFATGYFFKSEEDLDAVAEIVPEGRTTQVLAEWARARQCVIVGGLPERGGEGGRFNSAVVVGPEGFVGQYRKVHLFYEEKLLFAPGDLGFPVFDLATRAGERYRLGVMICFDWYFPEAARTLALAGADLVAHPANLVRPDCPRAMPIRALENHVFTITANRHGQETKGKETLTFIGQSEICDPSGEILARAPRAADAVEVVPIDPAAARDRQITAHNELFRDRRPDVYALGGGEAGAK